MNKNSSSILTMSMREMRLDHSGQIDSLEKLPIQSSDRDLKATFNFIFELVKIVIFLVLIAMIFIFMLGLSTAGNTWFKSTDREYLCDSFNDSYSLKEEFEGSTKIGMDSKYHKGLFTLTSISGIHGRYFANSISLTGTARRVTPIADRKDSSNESILKIMNSFHSNVLSNRLRSGRLNVGIGRDDVKSLTGPEKTWLHNLLNKYSFLSIKYIVLENELNAMEKANFIMKNTSFSNLHVNISSTPDGTGCVNITKFFAISKSKSSCKDGAHLSSVAQLPIGNPIRGSDQKCDSSSKGEVIFPVFSFDPGCKCGCGNLKHLHSGRCTQITKEFHGIHERCIPNVVVSALFCH